MWEKSQSSLCLPHVAPQPTFSKDTYVVAAFASWIWELGHVRLIIQSDGEPAILALVAAVRDKVIADGKAEQITCQTSPKGSHESNGTAERTVQQVRGMARVYLEHVREKTGSEFPPKSPWWAWALRHAGVGLQQISCESGHARNTIRQDQAQKTYAQPVLPFGELVLARRPGAHLQKSQTQFVCGCWLGRDSHTDEHIVQSLLDGSWCRLFDIFALRRFSSPSEGFFQHLQVVRFQGGEQGVWRVGVLIVHVAGTGQRCRVMQVVEESRWTCFFACQASLLLVMEVGLFL